MNLITKNTDYALRALIYLAGKNYGFVASSEISRDEKIPLAYLRRILQTLQQAGLVETREGARGGAALAKAPGKIRLYDVIRAFQGEVNLTRCVFRDKVCQNTGCCSLRKHVLRIEDMVNDELNKLTLKSLINER